MATSPEQPSRRDDALKSRTYAVCRDFIRRSGLHIGAVVGVSPGGLCEVLLRGGGVRQLYAVPGLGETDQGLLELTRQRLAEFGDRCRVLPWDPPQMGALPRNLDFVCLDADEQMGSSGGELPFWASRVRDEGMILVHGRARESLAEMRRELEAVGRRFARPVHAEGKNVWWLPKPAMHISYIVPAYNCADYVLQAVDSIASSNLEEGDEVILVDDASTDDTKDRLEQLSRRYGAVQVVSHAINKGTAAAARNSGIERALNPVVFCLDADNVLAPNSVRPLAEHLVASGADAAAFGEIHYFRRNPKQVTHKWIFREQVSLADALSGVIWPGPSGNYMFTRESWTRAGRYHEPSLENRSLDSWTFGIRQLASGSTLVCLPGTSYFHRYGQESHYLRNWQVGSQSLAGLIGLIPFLDRLQPDDVEYIFSAEGRSSWFERLAEHPLRVRGAAAGVDGRVEYLRRFKQEQRNAELTSLVRKVRSRLARG